MLLCADREGELRQPIPFGKYYLLERINVGGMAEVFKAKATGVEGFERLVAVKRILPSIAEDEEFITMFVDEAKIAVQLQHANIAQIFDLGRVEGSFFIALEYVHGKDLRAIFNRSRQRGELLSVPMSCYCIMKLCEGLDYAHNKHDPTGMFLNLVHRDVSPQNILVSYEGEVKIIDFGIAKVVGKSGRTQAGILKGKFGYMSPEQVMGLEIDRRSDIFGVGICLYELLTGERLFVAESDFATLEKVRAVDIMPPSTYNRRIPEELEQIVMRALARDREVRYQNALQLHDDLQAFMHTSANLFSRKDLSGYMHRVFAEEIEKESTRDREYASLDPHANDDHGRDDHGDHGDHGDHDGTGLRGFDQLDPVSSVSAWSAADPYDVVASAPRPRKSTLLGMPHLASERARSVRAPSVPRLIPGPQSVPRGSRAPSRPSGVAPPPRARSQPPQTGQPRAGGHGQHGAMEWDDEELSTQIYDKPDDVLPPVASRPPSVSRPAPASRPRQSAAPPRPAQPFVPGNNPFAVAQPAAMKLPDEPLDWDNKPKGRPMFVAVVAVVAIIASIVFGLMLFGPREPGTVHLTTVPGRVSVTVDGKPLGPSNSPFVISELSPEKRHSIAVTSPGYRSWTSAVELEPGQVLALPAVHLERVETGFALDSVPANANVLLDGQRLAHSTPVRVIDMTPGEHRIRVELDGYAPWESVLHTSMGTVLPLPTLALQPLAAQPAARPISRWAALVAARAAQRAAAAQETTPNDEPGVSKATARTTTRAAARTPDSSSSTDDEASPVAATEPEAPDSHESPTDSSEGADNSNAAKGTLRVNTRPWSQVFIDGKPSGTTPRMNISLAAGPHTLLFVNDEFGVRKTVDVTIVPGKVETVVLNLIE